MEQCITANARLQNGLACRGGDKCGGDAAFCQSFFWPLAYYISGCVYNTVIVLWQLCCLLVPCIIGGDRSRWNLSLYLRRRFPTKGAVNKLPACVCLSVCLLECLFLSLPFILFVSVAVPYILNQWVPKCQITRLQRIQNSCTCCCQSS